VEGALLHRRVRGPLPHASLGPLSVPGMIYEKGRAGYAGAALFLVTRSDQNAAETENTTWLPAIELPFSVFEKLGSR
jgi:hypothetical protein